MARFPGYLVSKPHQAARKGADGPLPGCRRRLNVRVDAAREVEAPVDGGLYIESQFDQRQIAGSSAAMSAFSHMSEMVAQELALSVVTGAGHRGLVFQRRVGMSAEPPEELGADSVQQVVAV